MPEEGVARAPLGEQEPVAAVCVLGVGQVAVLELGKKERASVSAIRGIQSTMHGLPPSPPPG